MEGKQIVFDNDLENPLLERRQPESAQDKLSINSDAEDDTDFEIDEERKENPKRLKAIENRNLQ